MVERRDDIDDGWGDDAAQPAERPHASEAGDDEKSDKVDTAKNRLARINEHVRVDGTEEPAPISRPSLPTVPPPSGYDEVRRTSKRQAFDLDAALERRGLVPPPEPTPMPPIPPAPASSSPFFAAGVLPPRPPSTEAPPTLIDAVGPPRRPIAPVIAVVAVACAALIGIAVYGITAMRGTASPPPLASASVAGPAPAPAPAPQPTPEPIVPATVDTAPERAPQPTVPAPVPAPKTVTAPPPSTIASAPPPPPPPPPPPKPSAPAPAHTASATSTAAPGVEFLKRNL